MRDLILRRTLKSFAIMILRLSGVKQAETTPLEDSVMVQEIVGDGVTERISMMPVLKKAAKIREESGEKEMEDIAEGKVYLMKFFKSEVEYMMREVDFAMARKLEFGEKVERPEYLIVFEKFIWCL